MAVISTLVLVALVLLRVFPARSSTRDRNLPSSPRQLGLSLGDKFGCRQGDNCWTGVYVDRATNEILHLGTGGRAFLSPGTAAADSQLGCLRWWAKEDLLYLADCYDQPFRWPGAGSELRRDPPQAGVLAGFSAEVNTKLESGHRGEPAYDKSTRVDHTRLVRDPFGFLFPGCMYALSLRRGPPHQLTDSHEVHVVVNRDGTVTDVNGAQRFARWFFLEEQTLPHGYWPPGDAIVLLVDSYHRQPRGSAESVEENKFPKFTLFSSDGGRTWHTEDQLNSGHEEFARGVLSLVPPKAVSMFPVTPAMLPSAMYLNGDKADADKEATESAAIRDHKFQPVYEVFEAQPVFSSGDYGEIPDDLEAIIVISRAVPRPTQSINDISCVINGAGTRAVWLSWSMVLCSTARVKAGATTVYIATQGGRFSVDFSFVRSPAPRHMRIGWPATEFFDIAPRGFSPQSTENDFIHLEGGGMQGVSGEGPKLILCTMFKDEAMYLEEWLHYHQLLGVLKIHLYDNDSTDKSRSLLKKYERSKFVQIHDWPHKGAQTEALNDCLCRFRHATRWMSFIDVDEFIDPAPGLPMSTSEGSLQGRTHRSGADHVQFIDGFLSARRKRLRKLLEEWAPEQHTHCMAWVNYCSHGQLSKPPGGVIDNYQELEDMGERKIHMQKPLFRASESLTLRMIGPHFLLYATEDITKQYRRNLSCPYKWLDPMTLRIRHYRSKSLEEYVKRRTGPDSAYQNKQHTKERLALEWNETNAKCGTGLET